MQCQNPSSAFYSAAAAGPCTVHTLYHAKIKLIKPKLLAIFYVNTTNYFQPSTRRFVTTCNILNNLYQITTNL